MANKGLPKQKPEFISKAYELFDDFYAAAAPFRAKCEDNEEFYKTNHWHNTALREEGEPQPVTPVLFSTIENMLADIMDNYPEPVILPEESDDESLAGDLNDVVKYILKRRDYRQTYRRKSRQALIKGASVQEVFWDSGLYGGLGDVNIRNWDIKHFLFDPKCEDIQDGRACFKYGFYTREWLKQRYPGAMDRLRPDGYARGGNDAEDVLVIDYWYKAGEAGDERVHMAKLCGHVLLEESESERPQGMYTHGKYPFIVEPLFPLEGSPVGLGMVDILKNLQTYADSMDQIIMKNALMSGKVKMLINRNAELEEDALTDWNRDVVRGSRIDESSVRWFQASPLNPYVMAHYNNKIEAIKEESGQSLFNRGESGRGVTAASAILALQEAGNKRSRLIVEQLYDGYEKLIRMAIDVIAENYDEDRVFRIRGLNAQREILLNGNMLKESMDGMERFVEFDINVQVEKQTPYSTLYQNELALQLMGANIINRDQCLELMSFEGKEKILRDEQQAALDMPLDYAAEAGYLPDGGDMQSLMI